MGLATPSGRPRYKSGGVRRISALILVTLFAALPACGPTINATFQSPEPPARNAAIVQAAATRDAAAVPDLVRMLDSDDPATRLLAIDALERITGTRNGFEYQASELERSRAVDRWVQWVKERGMVPVSVSSREAAGGRP